MRSAEIRERFLRFFTERGHTAVPSASLLAEDPTLLLVNAGMVPFKPYFLGEAPAPYRRATSVQKCVRTSDIDIIGTTTRHTTFFQMAGNFSFGDYFKEGAIPLAWELLTAATSDGGYALDPARLWATVYEDDDEAFDIWTRVVGLPAERVQRRGKADNYWHMGVPGPGGPCSEIYYDRGPGYGADGGPIADEERYLEVWNLVFMQSELSAVRSKEDFEIRGDLPAKNIDTGLGVERMAVLLQGVDNIYETDLLRPLLDRARELTGARESGSGAGAAQRERPSAEDVRLRVIAEHTRTLTMLIADGVVPSNEGRGYVVRRMLRRVVRNLRLLGAGDPVLGALVDTAVEVMAPSYPELRTDSARIRGVATAEEGSFLSTLTAGSALFDRAVAAVRTTTSGVAGNAPARLSGAQAFQLHDTFGFPIDLAREMAVEAGLQIDEDEFHRLMAEQRERAKRDAQEKKTGHLDVSVYRGLLDAGGATTFTGYVEASADARIVGVLRSGMLASAAGAGDQVEVTLDRTPFYAESGGQLADEGTITLASGAVLEVFDVQRPIPDLVVHRARVVSGEVSVGERAHALIDVERRRAISRAHTATHLVHQAIRAALGEQAAQAGSFNGPGRFRFDFSAPAAVPASVVAEVEEQVNRVLAADLPVRAFVTTQEEARRIGALALFGEKYGEAVRVVEVGDYARELCGGTHAARSGQLGMVKLLTESSIGTGVRRIEALVGYDAFAHLAREHVLVAQLAEALKARPEELPERVADIVERLRRADKELERLRSGAVLADAPRLVAEAHDVFGVTVVVHQAPEGTVAEDLRRLALDVRGRIAPGQPGVVAMAAGGGERAQVVVAVNDTAREWRLAAGALVRVAAARLGGSGGGRDDVAQGGGTRPDAIPEALQAVEHAVGQHVTGGG